MIENAGSCFARSKMDDVYVKSLERCHAQMVYDHWPYRESTRVEYMADEIQQFPSAGVFLKESNELVSWMMIHLPNGMSRLHTLEQHRRKGYAAIVTKYLSKVMAQSGQHPPRCFAQILWEHGVPTAKSWPYLWNAHHVVIKCCDIFILFIWHYFLRYKAT